MSDLLGIGGEIAWQGKTYRLGPCTFKVADHFAAGLRRRAWDAIEAIRQDLPIPVYQMHMDTWQQACAAGTYDWGELAALQAMSRESGQKEMVLLLLTAGGNPLSRDRLEALWADEGARTQALLYLAGVVGRRPDPTTPGATPGNGNGPSTTGSPASSTTRQPTSVT